MSAVLQGAGRRVLILVENLPSPFDRRVWQEATTLHAAGYGVSIVCPTGKGHESHYECLDGIHIYRYGLPTEAEGALGYLVEYSAALWHSFRLAFKVRRERGFDAIHACTSGGRIPMLLNHRAVPAILPPRHTCA